MIYAALLSFLLALVGVTVGSRIKIFKRYLGRKPAVKEFGPVILTGALKDCMIFFSITVLLCAFALLAGERFVRLIVIVSGLWTIFLNILDVFVFHEVNMRFCI